MVIEPGAGAPNYVAPAETLWHYTKREGLHGIVTESEIWASAPIALDDDRELRFGMEVLAEAWRDFSAGFADSPAKTLLDECVAGGELGPFENEAFVFSASLVRDLPSLWDEYAGCDGYVIAMQPSTGLLTDSFVGGPVWSGPLALPIWRRVLYRATDQRSWADEFLTATFEVVELMVGLGLDAEPDRRANLMAWVQSQLQAEALGMKRDCWSGQHEVRFIVPRAGPGPVSHRMAGGKDTPFLILREVPRRETPAGQKPLLKITEVMCPPGTTGATRDEVRRLLDDHGYSKSDVTVSPRP